MRVPNRYAAAFKENGNLIGLASAAALSFAFLNPLPLLGAIALEAAYLAIVPDSKWYEKRLDKRYDQEIIDRREKLKAEILPSLIESVRFQFSKLEDQRKQIGAQAQGEDKWFREALRKLDYLLEKHLHFGAQQEKFSQYLSSLEAEGSGVPPIIAREQEGKNKRRTAHRDEDWIDRTVSSIKDRYAEEMASINERLASDTDFPTRRLEEKRVDIIKRRSDYVDRIGMILHNLGGQMRLIQDTFGLINDEIRARSPEQVLADIDEVVTASNSLAEAIDSVAPLEELVAKLG